MSLEEGKVFAGHRIDGVVGKGGMGVVYRATQLALDLTVALKVMAPDLAYDDAFRERFRRESRLAASLDDPHIVPVRHAGEEEGLLYVTMRLVEGPDLGLLLEREGPLEPARAVAVVEQIGSALDAAHGKGLIHRDVKPANILVDPQPSGLCAYLTDFGLTRRSVGSSGLTRTGQWVGTIDYVAPEQIRGDEIDERADLYSLGCVLFQALTGHAPFEQESRRRDDVRPPRAAAAAPGRARAGPARGARRRPRARHRQGPGRAVQPPAPSSRPPPKEAVPRAGRGEPTAPGRAGWRDAGGRRATAARG